MRTVFQHVARFVAVITLMFVAVCGSQVKASDKGDERTAVKKSESAGAIARPIASPRFVDQSEDLISGRRYLKKSSRSAYSTDLKSLRLSGNIGIGDELRSIAGTTKSLNRSMMSINNSVRRMNYSINHIRTFRRRF